MMTVRPKGQAMEGMDMPDDADTRQKMKMAAETGSALHRPEASVWMMTLISFAVLFAGALIALIFGGAR
jgi:hypothetical protein